MTRLKLLMTACCTAVLAILLVMTGSAQDMNTNQRTFLTFSAPVELPGVTLPAGRYLFKLADSPSNRHIVQVLSDDEQKMYATILAIPAQRAEPEGENVVTFGERPAGAAPAVKLWFYPGDTIGQEFVYPKDQAVRIARDTNQSVLSGDGTEADANLSRIDPSGEATAYNENNENTSENQMAAGQSSQPAPTGTTGTETATTASGTTGAAAGEQSAMAGTTATEQSAAAGSQTQTPAPGTTAGETMTPDEHAAMVNRQAAGTSGMNEQDTREQERTSLPRTASPLALQGLLGLLALGGALSLRRARR